MPLDFIKKRILAPAAAIAMLMLSSCGLTDTDKQRSDISYAVISNGTSAEPDSQSSVGETLPDAFSESDAGDTQLNIPPYMVTKYYSLSYSDRMRDTYNDVVDTISSFKEKTYIPLTISVNDYNKVLETVNCEQLAFFFINERSNGDYDSNAMAIEMFFSYKYTVDEVNSMLLETQDAAMKIIADTEGMSDYEKLMYFHDYLVLNVESSTDDPFADSIYGALVCGQALCEGYAKAFSYLCNIAGIENMIVTGYTDVWHMWNMVRLDGDWYHIDVGWDKPAAALLESYPDMVLYQYFLADDSIVKNNRIISNMVGEPPEANSDKYNYFVREGKLACDYDQALEIIEQSCAACIDAGEKYFMLKTDSSNLYLQTTSDLIRSDDDGVSDIDRIVAKLHFTGRISYIDYYKAYRIIIFVLE